VRVTPVSSGWQIQDKELPVFAVQVVECFLQRGGVVGLSIADRAVIAFPRRPNSGRGPMNSCMVSAAQA